jgi:hypothetical protein
MTDFNALIREAAGHQSEATRPATDPPTDPDEAAWLAEEQPIRHAIETAATRAGFIDPEDAVHRLRYSVRMGADGLPDPYALRAALGDIARNSPHLIGPPATGSGDSGARTSPRPSTTDFNEWIRRAAGW